MAFLRNTDPFESALMQAIAHGVLKAEERRDQNRAVMIANAVGKALFGR